MSFTLHLSQHAALSEFQVQLHFLQIWDILHGVLKIKKLAPVFAFCCRHKKESLLSDGPGGQEKKIGKEPNLTQKEHSHAHKRCDGGKGEQQAWYK